MEKLQLCRICLAKNVPMYVVVNKNLQEVYVKLTDIPFVTEDRRPILACSFCCAKLKQCFRLMKKCLEAEQLFAQMMNEDYEPNTLIKPDYCSGFITTPTVHISIVEEGQTQSIFAIKEESPEVCEGVDDIYGNLSDDQEPKDVDKSCLDVKVVHPQHSESDPGGDVPLMEVSIQEAIDVSKRKRRAVETNSATDTRETKLEDTTTVELKKNEQSYLKVFRTTRKRKSKSGTSHKKTYQCDICQSIFSRKGVLAKHIRIHTGDKPFKCDVCQRSFSESGSLKKHFRIHTGEKPYSCDLCWRRFSDSGGLRNHIRIHTGDKPFKCDVCQRAFSESGALRRHFRIHTGEKPHSCDVCQRSFSERSSLRKHMRTHTGDKPFKCDVCQRSFSETGSLTKHMRTHTGEKPFMCNVCQRGFTESGALRKHFRIHTGEKPYKCNFCQHSFTQKTSLNTHNLKHTIAKS